jgi:hypothetical protein
MIAVNCSAVRNDLPTTSLTGFYASGVEYLGNDRILFADYDSYWISSSLRVFNPYNASSPRSTLAVRTQHSSLNPAAPV